MPDTQSFQNGPGPDAPATAAEGGFPPPQPIRPLRAWKAFQGLVRDK